MPFSTNFLWCPPVVPFAPRSEGPPEFPSLQHNKELSLWSWNTGVGRSLPNSSCARLLYSPYCSPHHFFSSSIQALSHPSFVLHEHTQLCSPPTHTAYRLSPQRPSPSSPTPCSHWGQASLLPTQDCKAPLSPLPRRSPPAQRSLPPQRSPLPGLCCLLHPPAGLAGF